MNNNETSECQFHNNCGGWCETPREVEHNLCEHCLETHDEETHGPAGTAEVERLRAVVNRCRNKVSKAIIDKLKLRLERDTLRAQLAEMTTERDRLRDGLDNANINISNWRKENERLRLNISEMNDEAKLRDAQLAERDALLRKAWRGPRTDEDCAAIDAALSASAEPSAPVERDELAESGKCIDGGDCGVGGICKWCPHARAVLERNP